MWVGSGGNTLAQQRKVWRAGTVACSVRVFLRVRSTHIRTRRGRVSDPWQTGKGACFKQAASNVPFRRSQVWQPLLRHFFHEDMPGSCPQTATSAWSSSPNQVRGMPLASTPTVSVGSVWLGPLLVDDKLLTKWRVLHPFASEHVENRDDSGALVASS